jgi:hypothetical protein
VKGGDSPSKDLVFQSGKKYFAPVSISGKEDPNRSKIISGYMRLQGNRF